MPRPQAQSMSPRAGNDTTGQIDRPDATDSPSMPVWPPESTLAGLPSVVPSQAGTLSPRGADAAVSGMTLPPWLRDLPAGHHRRARTALDWIGAVTLDLLTLAWIGLLVAWWL